jgi:hypothetical protein
MATAAMQPDCKALAVLVAPHTLQVAILDISTHLSCVSNASARPKASRWSALRLGIMIAWAILLISSLHSKNQSILRFRYVARSHSEIV